MNKVLAILVFYSEDGQHFSRSDTENLLANRYKHTRWMQAAFFVLSVASGTTLIYRVNYSNWLVNMQEVSDTWSTPQLRLFNGLKQCPPLGTIWVYTILQLDLVPAVMALAAVAAWVRWSGARLVFN